MLDHWTTVFATLVCAIFMGIAIGEGVMMVFEHAAAAALASPK